MFVLGFVVRFIGISENLFCPIMKKKYIYIFYLVQVSQCYQAVSLLIFVKEQCIIRNGHFPASMLYFYELVIKI